MTCGNEKRFPVVTSKRAIGDVVHGDWDEADESITAGIYHVYAGFVFAGDVRGGVVEIPSGGNVEVTVLA